MRPFRFIEALREYIRAELRYRTGLAGLTILWFFAALTMVAATLIFLVYAAFRAAELWLGDRIYAALACAALFLIFAALFFVRMLKTAERLFEAKEDRRTDDGEV